MANLYDYVKHYKDVSFEEIPFHEMDALLLSQLAYLRFEDKIPVSIDQAISLEYLYEYVSKTNPITAGSANRYLVKEAITLLKKMLPSSRFSSIKVFNRVRKVDATTQFSAISFLLANRTICISFEGTDSSISGWKEDFALMYQFPVKAQSQAIAYINQTVGFFSSNVIVLGHSKGGNLALVAAMYAKKYIQKKIVAIYNFDGPGLLKEQFDSIEYKKIIPKLKVYVPQDSFFGMLFYQPDHMIVVKSRNVGFFQHDVYNWECFGSVLIRDRLSKQSKQIQKQVMAFIDGISISERKEFVEELFVIFHKVGVTDFHELKLTKLDKSLSLVKEIQAMNQKTKNRIMEFLKLMIGNL